MKKEFDLKIDGGTLESIKIDSLNSLIIATYKRDADEFKAGDILIDAYDDYNPSAHISIFKEKSKIYDDEFSAFIAFEICCDWFGFEMENWDEIRNNRLATDEEKQLLFDALEKEGKRWNVETKCIEGIPKRKFKAGDKVTLKSGCTSKSDLAYRSEFDEYIGKELMVIDYTESGNVRCHNSFCFSEGWLELYVGKQQPKFKRGDILASKSGGSVLIFDKYTSRHIFSSLINNHPMLSNNSWYEPIFRHASIEEIEVFYKYLARMGKKWNSEKLEIEELDISEIVVDYESAIEYLGIKDNLLIFKNDNRTDKFNAQIKLQLIAEAWNKIDGFEADWENFDQYKYYPAFKVRDGKIEFSHTSFTNGLWGITRGTLDFHTSSFGFKTEERARQFGNQFIGLFKIALGF